MNLRGAGAVVTGASRGLGPVIAGALAAKGAHVVLTARSADELEAVRSRIEAAGGTAAAVPADITDPAGRSALVEQAESVLGGIDILVNNAGLEIVGAFAEMDDEAIRDIVETNLTATMLLTRLALPAMLRRKRGHVVNISSLAAKAVSPFDSVYAATKAALIGWTYSLRVELRKTGVSVSVVSPGFVEREGMFAQWGDAKAAKKAGALTTPEKVAAGVVKVIERDMPEMVLANGFLPHIADVALAAAPSLALRLAAANPATKLFRNEAARRRSERPR